MIYKITEFTDRYDRTLDYIPFISTIHNVIKIFLKTRKVPELSLANIGHIESRYEYRLKKNGYARFFLLIIPVFGNLVVLIKDNIDRNKLLDELRVDGNKLEGLSRFEKTKEACLAAVAKTPSAIQFVPIYLDGTGSSDDYNEVALCAVSNDGLALKFVNEFWLNEELCQAAVSNNGLALKFVPKKMQTKTLCEIAVANNGLALQFVYELWLKEELSQIAVANNGLALQFVPWEKRTKDLCLIAVSNNGLALQFVPLHFRTEDLCLIAVSNNGLALQFVPADSQSESVKAAAIKQNPQASQFIFEKKPETMAEIKAELMEILGISIDDDFEEKLPKAFRKWSLKNHPDKYVNLIDKEEMERLEARFQYVNELRIALKGEDLTAYLDH